MKKYTAKRAAIDLIRAYVERGDSLKSIQGGYLGSYSPEYHASIGGMIFLSDKSGESVKKIPPTKILVKTIGSKTVNKVFSLKDIYDEIKSAPPPTA